MNISEQIAHTLYNRLVSLCGYRDSEMNFDNFIYTVVKYLDEKNIKSEDDLINTRLRNWPILEYRFQGKLGFGGKIVHQTYSGFYVQCYREDETPERLKMLEDMNSWLEHRGWRKCRVES